MSEGHTDLSGLHCHRGHGDVQAHAAAEDHVWIHGPTEARVCLMSVAQITIQSHSDAYGLGATRNHADVQKPC